MTKVKEEDSRSWILGYDCLDFDSHFYSTLLNVFLIRFGMAMTFGEQNYHPDQNWQGLEIAYKIAYGD